MNNTTPKGVYEAYTVTVEGGAQYLNLNGVQLPFQIETVVTQSAEDDGFHEGICFVTVKVAAKLIDTKKSTVFEIAGTKLVGILERNKTNGKK